MNVEKNEAKTKKAAAVDSKEQKDWPSIGTKSS